MRKTLPLAAGLLVIAVSFCIAAGAKESAGSATRGDYLAASGVIIPPQEVYIDSYIAQLDYDYPAPETELGVTVDTGNRLIPLGGGKELIQIGLKGKDRDFSELPPLNLAFVIDKSGSMDDQDKMDWVKESFKIFVGKVRETDYVSLIVFDNEAKVLIPSTRMKNAEIRQRFSTAVERIAAGGGTNLVAGATLGYQQVSANFRVEYTNRVLLLTDGMGNIGDNAKLLELAESYRKTGMNISTIGLGKNFDLKFMTDLAHAGGGSSRFISDGEEMKKTFGTEFDRMVVPVARDLEVDVTFSGAVKPAETWGYDNTIDGTSVRYSLSTLHNRDFETILLLADIPPSGQEGPFTIGSVSVSYTDLEGNRKAMGPFPIECEASGKAQTIAGYSNFRTIRSGCILDFARSLIEIGTVYYSGQGEDVTKRSMELTREARNRLLNARTRLDDRGFDKEMKILENYIRILGRTGGMSDAAMADIMSDTELKPPAPDRGLADHLDSLFREILLQLPRDRSARLAVADFSFGDRNGTTLQSFIREAAQVSLGRRGSVVLLERSELDKVLREQELSLASLADTDKAIEIGRLLSASHILTGSILEMKTSYIVFARCIDTTTGEIVSVAQVILDRVSVENTI